ncbi:hypothetical protein KO361_03805 [Candidatus Woesearchaeota archaeon]|nr:hypothetical protein [Candidatus Woesearchaeota archaeon]
MKQKILLIILAVTLLLLTACEEGQAPNQQTGFVGGTKGIEMSFVTNAPPEKVSDGGQEPFDVVIELTNRGEHEVLREDVFVKLEGFSASSFGVTNNDLIAHPEDDLFAVRKSPDGSIITSPSIPVVFEGLNYQLSAPANVPFTFRAKACYTYETIAITDICVKENYNDDRAGDLCKVSGERTVSNSGAPVQVTSIRQAPQGRDKSTITFSIQQKDLNPAGKVSRTNTECSTAQQDEERVFVSVTGLVTGTTDEVRCIGLIGGDSSSGYITLTKNEPREVSCTITLADRNTRVQPFRITLGYDYSTYIDETVTVVYTPE